MGAEGSTGNEGGAAGGTGVYNDEEPSKMFTFEENQQVERMSQRSANNNMTNQ
jgi:hypothetical protein